MYSFYLTCPRGLEETLQTELQHIIPRDITIDKGGVAFNGNKEDMYKVNYQTRIGMNLLIKLFESNISNYDSIYKIIYNYNWNKIFNNNNDPMDQWLEFNIRTLNIEY